MATNIDRVLDDEGDVALILHNPNKPFAVWDECDDWKTPISSWPEPESIPGLALRFREVDPGGQVQAVPEQFIWNSRLREVEPEQWMVETAEAEAVDEEVHETVSVASGKTEAEDAQTRFRLSSRHLVLASPYFRAALKGSWKEGISAAGSLYTVEAYDWNEEAFQIIMNVVHSKTEKVPRRVSLELLAQIAVVVDYYKFHGAVKFFSDTWIEEIGKGGSIPEEYCRDLILWLCVACVFEKAEIFHTVTSVAAPAIRGPLQTLGLPFPGNFIGA